MAEIDLIGLLEGNVKIPKTELERRSPRVDGVIVGVVSDIEDREGLGRVRVRFPFSGRTESAWARVAVPWAGSNRGTYFVPKRDDEVLVAFRDGNLGHPYVLGFLWSQSVKPPEESPKPGRSVIRSAHGHVIELDDVKKRVTVRTSTGPRIVLDETDNVADIEVSDAEGTKTVKITLNGSSGEIQITAPRGGKVGVSAPEGSITVEADTVSVKAAKGALTLEGQTVSITGHSLVAINP